MAGNDQVRFCQHCNLHVNDLSQMTRTEALRLVTRSRGRLCVRYVRTAGGEILTRESQMLHQLGGRVSRIAAGAFAAAISISTAAAQSSSEVRQPPAAAKVLSVVPEGAGVSGVVTDPNGAVVPGATITLVNRRTNQISTYTTKDDGAYKFSLLEAGRYSLEARAASFNDGLEIMTLETSEIMTRDITMRIPDIIAEVEVKEPVALQGMVVISEPYNPLIKAVFKDDLASAVTLIPVTSDVNANDAGTGINAISYAIENHNAEMVNVLLSAGASLRNADRYGRTPLMHLNDEASGEFARQLIAAGADVNARNEDGETVLLAIADSCKFEVFKELIAAGARLDAKDNHNNTILMHAVENEEARVAKFLVEAGVSVDARNDEGESALTFAARSGKGAALKTLISGGATINLTAGDFDQALRTALDNEDSSTVKILLDAGANPNSIDDDGKTALMRAARKGKPVTVKVLIDAGAELNAVDNEGWTALMYCDDVESVRVLLDAGADMNIKSKNGDTALAIASRAGEEEIMKLLKSRGAPQ
jgi:ankyrin repeat protein